MFKKGLFDREIFRLVTEGGLNGGKICRILLIDCKEKVTRIKQRHTLTIAMIFLIVILKANFSVVGKKSGPLNNASYFSIVRK